MSVDSIHSRVMAERRRQRLGVAGQECTAMLKILESIGVEVRVTGDLATGQFETYSEIELLILDHGEHSDTEIRQVVDACQPSQAVCLIYFDQLATETYRKQHLSISKSSEELLAFLAETRAEY